MTAPAEVLELIQRFDIHREAYRSGRYNEEQLHAQLAAARTLHKTI